MKKHFKFTKISCKKATELIEKRDNFSLNPVEKLQLSFHLKMCDPCSEWVIQSESLDSTMKEYANRTTDCKGEAKAKLSSTAKAKILDKLKGRS